MMWLPTSPADVLNPTEFGELEWAKHLQRGATEAAKERYVDWIRNGAPRTNLETDLSIVRSRWFDKELGRSGGHRLDADDVVDGVYTGVYGVTHTFSNGVDWHFNPTVEREDVDYTVEWQEQINRHYQWIQLADAYDDTGDPKYATAWERELRSWIEHCPRPNDSGNTVEEPSTWRTIATGIRAGTTWPYAFETFRHSDDVTDEALWLFVCAMREHGVHLLYYPTGYNFKTMEANGLTHVGGMFPSLRTARAFYLTGIDRTIAEIERQFYPDGQHTELAPSYGGVAITNVYAALGMATWHLKRWGDVPGGVGYAQSSPDTCSIPSRSWERLTEIVKSYATLAAPDGCCPPMHDSPPFPVERMYEEFRTRHANAESTSRPWQDGGSTLLPWGGYGILRSSDQYALLDAGPWGTGHQHDDALQFLAFADEHWLLVDPGKPRYDDSAITHHIKSSAAHNVVQIDQQRHLAAPRQRIVDEPFPIGFHTGEGVSIAAAGRQFETCEDEFRFHHERVCLELETLGYLIVDRLRPADDHEHVWEWLWHTPVSEVRLDDRSARLVTEGESIGALRSESTFPVDVSYDIGARDPLVRGWKTTATESEPEPLPVVRMVSEPIAGEARHATLLTSTDGDERGESSLRVEQSSETMLIDIANGRFEIELSIGDEVGGITWRLEDEPARTIELDEHCT